MQIIHLCCSQCYLKATKSVKESSWWSLFFLCIPLWSCRLPHCLYPSAFSMLLLRMLNISFSSFSFIFLLVSFTHSLYLSADLCPSFVLLCGPFPSPTLHLLVNLFILVLSLHSFVVLYLPICWSLSFLCIPLRSPFPFFHSFFISRTPPPTSRAAKLLSGNDFHPFLRTLEILPLT